MNKMNGPVINQSKPRRKFDVTFKKEAVENWLSSGKPASVIAEELGINANCLYNWRAAFRPAQPHKTPVTNEELTSEVASLRRELERVRQQRDILKKTLGILSELPNNASSASTR